MLTIDQAFLGIRMITRSLHARLADDSGIEDSPAKMIWIAAGVAFAVAAVGVALVVFNAAEDKVTETSVLVPTPD